MIAGSALWPVLATAFDSQNLNDWARLLRVGNEQVSPDYLLADQLFHGLK